MANLLPPHLMDYENVERRRHPAIYREEKSSAQLGPVRLDKIFLNQLLKTSAASRYMELEQTFSELRDELKAVGTLKADWDSYDAPVPTATAVESADRALAVLRSLNAKPSAVLPAADGGVGICVVEEQRYAHLEFANDGDVWVLMYGPTGSPESWQLRSNDTDSISEGWTRISGYLQS